MTITSTIAPCQAFAVPPHFTGKEHDTETGNDYFMARYYNSATGRFLSPDWDSKSDDPVPYAKLDNPQTLNLYAYVRNNPMELVDTDGHDVIFANDNLKKRYDAISKESTSFSSEVKAEQDDHNLTVNVVERGLRVNDEKSNGDATITFKSDGTTTVTVYIDSYRTSDQTIEHETGHGKDARTNREQLKSDALTTQRNKGGPDAQSHDDRPEEKRANQFRDQVEGERKTFRKEQKKQPKPKKEDQE